jgi:hypothetical protein
MAAYSFAAEKRCDDLGANCVCSEPLNTNTLNATGSYFNPADSTTKECNVEGVAGAVFARNSNDITQTNNSTIFAAFPSGHQVSFVSRGSDGHVGIFWVGARLGSSFVKRAAIRLYTYYSSNFQFAYTASCQNHKHFETDSMITSFEGTDAAGNGGGTHNAYNWLNGWNHAVDCCSRGPNSINYFGVTPASAKRGKWWRIELVLTNRAGGSSPNGFRAQIYEKNVTDNGPDELVLDTGGTFFSGLQTWGAWTDLTPPSRQDALNFAAYRQNICAGYYAFSHVLVAGWDTDQGQRIGIAYEVEGSRPSAPGNLRIRP